MAFDLEIGAATVFMEASGEPPDGKAAVAAVLANRLRDGRWGSTLAAVCLAPDQFSCWNTGDPNRRRMAETPDTDPSLIQCEAAMRAALGGKTDPTFGAMWYCAADIRSPGWVDGAVFCGQFGSQLFYKGVK